MILLKRRNKNSELDIYHDLKVNYQKRYKKCSNILCGLDDIKIVLKHFMGDEYMMETTDSYGEQWTHIRPLPSVSLMRYTLAKKYLEEYGRNNLNWNFRFR